MNSNCKNTDILLKLYFTDKELFIKIAENVIKHLYTIRNKQIKFNNTLVDYIGIFPRITYFETSAIENNIIRLAFNSTDNIRNTYIYNGLSTLLLAKNSYIYSNYVLPHPSNSNIPFTIGYTKANIFNLLNTNIFYFEVFIDKINFRSPFLDEILHIGFANVIDDHNTINLGTGESFGIDCMMSNFISNKYDFFLPDLIEKGDTIGIGLEYLDNYIYKPFITHNGTIVNITRANGKDVIITTQSLLKVIIKLKLSVGIEVNFGNKEYKFNIETLNRPNKIINSTQSNIINNEYKTKYIESKYIYYETFNK